MHLGPSVRDGNICYMYLGENHSLLDLRMRGIAQSDSDQYQSWLSVQYIETEPPLKLVFARSLRVTRTAYTLATPQPCHLSFRECMHKYGALIFATKVFTAVNFGKFLLVACHHARKCNKLTSVSI